MKNRLASLHRKHDRSKSSFVASVIVHGLLFGLVMLVAGRAVKKVTEKTDIVVLRPPPPPPPPPPPAGGRTRTQREKKPVEIKPVEVIIPVEIPKEVVEDLPEVEVETESEDEGVDGGVEGGVEGGVIGGVVGGEIGGVLGGTLGGVLGNPLPEAPPSNEPRRITSDVTPPVLLKKIEPDYPIMAKRAKVSGEVVLECIIDEDGNVAIHKVLKKVDLVQQAAEAAVKQWKYQPALMEGRPQAVYLIVKLQFNLSG